MCGIIFVEPNIESKARDKLLKDLYERIELLGKVFAGDTGTLVPDAYRKTLL